jgi:5-methylcytosine-specific restriction endonuclease McrA
MANRWRGCRRHASSYKERDLILKKAGFASYRDYLSSPTWWKIRARVMEKAGGKCRICGGKAAQAHHVFYSRSNLKGSNLTGVVAICRQCHEEVEFTDGKKLNQEASRKKYSAASPGSGTKSPRCITTGCGEPRAPGRKRCDKHERELSKLMKDQHDDRRTEKRNAS